MSEVLKMERYKKATVGLLALFFLFGCESLFFWPSKNLVGSPEHFNFSKQDVYFTTEDGLKLHGWRLPAGGKSKVGTIFFLHGNAQNLSYHIANSYWLINEGWEVVIIDYRGYGLSEGEPDISSIQKDALAGYQSILSEREDNLPIIVWGQSLGATVAINMVAELSTTDKPQGLIVDSAFSSHRKIMQETLGKSWITWLFQYPLSWFVRTDYSPSLFVGQIEDVPLLIVHSERDPLINIEHAKEIYELANWPKELWISEQPGHINIWDDLVWREKLVCQLRDWPDLKPMENVCEHHN
ncbi:alpha/beta hydrolase [Vibrio natriegens]|uniref:alpha/beta hydrolase n=1 Tax=Vibrio natriegens TaxID=691 RepID=UPI001FBAFEE4|nr:alpha/beta hydrolase [Vibrio natriegens]